MPLLTRSNVISPTVIIIYTFLTEYSKPTFVTDHSTIIENLKNGIRLHNRKNSNINVQNALLLNDAALKVLKSKLRRHFSD